MVDEQSTRPVRKIIHIDMDAFYASIEQRDQPALRGKPIIVGGDPEKRGVVATCSYEARRYGIHSAMPSRTAYRLCPHAVFLRPRFDVYRAVSTQVMRIFRDYTDLVEPLSLDEAFLDVTTNTRHEASATRIAREIKLRIQAQVGLTASAGVSFNKFIAKLASDYQKPDGLTVVPPPQATQFLDRTPIDKFFGVGRVTGARLKELGVQNGADLRHLGEERLRSLFQERGSQLYAFACARDERSVQPLRIRKSLGKETTLVEDSVDPTLLLSLLTDLAGQVEQRLIALDLWARTVTLKVKWQDFQQITRSVSLPAPIQQGMEMVSTLTPVLLSTLATENKGVRLIGVTTSNLLSSYEKSKQGHIMTPSLWDT